MGNVQHKGSQDGLTQFQKRKLKYDFDTFFDLNKDGVLSYSDFLWAKDKICFMSGWKIDNPKYKLTEQLFTEIWNSLEMIADIDKDGKISKKEWLMMWTLYKKEIMEQEKEKKEFLQKLFDEHKEYHAQRNDDVSRAILMSSKAKVPPPSTNRTAPDEELVLDSDEEPPSFMADGVQVTKSQSDSEHKDTVLEQFSADKQSFLEDSKLPRWLFKYLVFRFILLDRTGDNVIDNEEYEYVLSEFGVSDKMSRQAFRIFTQNNTVDLDFEYFVKLFEQFYLSNDPADLGNFINGKLVYEAVEGEDEDGDDGPDPGRLEHRVNSSSSFHSMDEDLYVKPKEEGEHPEKKINVPILLDEQQTTANVKMLLQNAKQRCCLIG